MLFDLSFASEILRNLASASAVTIQVTLASFTLAVFFGLILFIQSQTAGRATTISLRFLSDFIRSTPLLIQLYAMYFVLPEAGIRLSPMLGGVLVLGLHYGCYAAETYRAAYFSVPEGQWEAAYALGLSRAKTGALVIFPQMLPTVVVGLGNSLIALFKESATLSAIGVMELLSQAKEIGSENFRYTEPITLAGVIYLTLSLVAAAAISAAERKFKRHARSDRDHSEIHHSPNTCRKTGNSPLTNP